MVDNCPSEVLVGGDEAYRNMAINGIRLGVSLGIQDADWIEAGALLRLVIKA